MLYWINIVVNFGAGDGKEAHMIIDKNELKNLRDELERLTDFIRKMDEKDLPYFYHCFDTMKNNIDLFLRVGGDDIRGLFPVLERDWKASHTAFLGVQEYDLREIDPEIDPRLCFYFARLVSEVGKYFERKQEFYS